MKRYFLVLFAAINMYATAQVQKPREPNELSIYGGIGLLSLTPTSGFFNGYALDLGVGYTHFFNKKWGIHIGIGPGFYNVNNYEDIKVFTPNLTDRNGYRVELHTTTDINENYNTLFLKIPVMLQYQNLQPPNWREEPRARRGFYAMGGIKAIMPFISNYEAKNTSLTNLAYYPELDNWAGTQLFAGYGTFDGRNINEDFEINTIMMLALEGGIKWRLKRGRLLYTGIYLDYGLNVNVSDNRTTFRNYVAVEQLTNFPLFEFTDKINIMSVGVKLRLALYRTPREGICPF